MNANVSIYQDSVKDSSGILTSESNEMGLSTIFNYNGNNVAFIKTSYGILINATDMARPYNKRPVDYLRQMYVNELVSTIVSQTHISEDQLVIKMRGSSENGGGTWLYEDVAIDFAQWLDVKFKVWCNSKIKELLTTGLVKLPNFNNPPEAARAWADAPIKVAVWMKNHFKHHIIGNLFLLIQFYEICAFAYHIYTLIFIYLYIVVVSK